MTTVTSSLDAGAEMITFFAPPESTCARALVASVKKPVDSTTTSTPRSAHFRWAGSRSAKVLTTWAPTRISSSVAVTSASRRPRMESNFSNGARELLSVRSLTATISMSAPKARTARKKLRPIRPKPLMPTRTVTEYSLVVAVSVPRAYRRRSPPVEEVALRPSRNQRNGPEAPGNVTVDSILVRQHLGRQRGLRVRDPELLGALVGHREEPADPAGDG